MKQKRTTTDTPPSNQVTKEPGKKMDIWLKIIPIALTAIGLSYTIYLGFKPSKKHADETWQETKKIYNEVRDLAGEIVAAKRSNNDSLLKRLSGEFNKYLIKLKGVNESENVRDQMTVVYGYLDDAIKGIEIISAPDMLEKSCAELTTKIIESINKVDKEQ